LRRTGRCASLYIEKETSLEVARLSIHSSRSSPGLLDIEPHLILEQVEAEVKVVLVLEHEEQHDGGLIEDKHVEDNVNEVGDDTLGLDDVCTMRDDVCTRSTMRERRLPIGSGSRLPCTGDLRSTIRCAGLRSGGGEPHQCQPLSGGLPVHFCHIAAVLGNDPVWRCQGSLQELLVVLLPDAWSLQQLVVVLLLPDELLLACSCGLLFCCWCTWLLKPTRKGTREGRREAFRRMNKRDNQTGNYMVMGRLY
jgi:hypothetical protein